MQYCPWCKRIRNFMNDEWKPSAEIPGSAKREPCLDCVEKKFKKIIQREKGVRIKYEC